MVAMANNRCGYTDFPLLDIHGNVRKNKESAYDI